MTKRPSAVDVISPAFDPFRRFWADDGLTGSYSESEGPLGHSGLLSPGLSANRTSPVPGFHMGFAEFRSFRKVH
jgi:hypothetical protein